MADQPPVLSRLSQLLVAFTIELDNEFEHRMPHRTAADRGTAGAARGPWLVSWVMWANVLRLVPAEGLPLRALAGPRGVPKLSGLQRWGYLTLEPGAGEGPSPRDWLVAPTRSGRRAGQIWVGLAAEVEQRWRDRFGADLVEQLRAALLLVADPALPRYLPVLGYGLVADTATPAPGPPPTTPDLSALLSWAVGRYTTQFEAVAPLSLAVSADVLRLLDVEGIALGSLPGLGGISKEAVSMAVHYLESTGNVTVGKPPTGGNTTLVRLTGKGFDTRTRCTEVAFELERAWPAEPGLVEAVDAFADRGDALAAGLQPYDDGWRAGRHHLYQTQARLLDPYATLPHHPMVLHRGGFPDGA